MDLEAAKSMFPRGVWQAFVDTLSLAMRQFGPATKVTNVLNFRRNGFVKIFDAIRKC
jgi:hypothetical protein